MFASRLLQQSGRALSLSSTRSLASAAAATSPALPEYLLRVPPTRVSVLSNGMRVATEQSVGETATVGVFINAGSSFETAEESGIAHFLEHMSFKGTSTRTQHSIEQEVEHMGASLNAFTSREQTVYYANVFKDKLGQGVDLLSDILQNSKYDPKHIEAERNTILLELEDTEANAQEMVMDHLHAASFQNSSLGNTILGPVENIKRISRDDLIKYVKSHYTADRMVLAAAGAVDHDALCDMAEKAFAKLPASGNSPAPTAAYFTPGMVEHVDESMEDLIHFAIAYEGVGHTDPDYYAMALIQNMIGSWNRLDATNFSNASFLTEVFAEGQWGGSKPRVHSYQAFTTSYHETGLFGTYVVAPTHPHHGIDYDLEYVTKAICQEPFKIAQRSVLAAQLDRAKAQLKAAILAHLDGTTPVCMNLGQSILTLGRTISPAELFMRIDAVSTKDIQRACDRFSEPSVVALGSTDAFSDYNQIARWSVTNLK